MNDAPQTFASPSDATTGPLVELPADELAATALPARPGEIALPEEEADGAAKLPKHATLLADGRVLLPLRYPVTLTVRIGHAAGQKQVFDQLKLRRVNGEDRKVLMGQPVEMRAVVLAARCAGMRVDLMNALYENMDGKDTTALEQVLDYFL